MNLVRKGVIYVISRKTSSSKSVIDALDILKLYTIFVLNFVKITLLSLFSVHKEIISKSYFI